MTPEAAFSECEDLTDGRLSPQLRQGDVFEWVEKSTDPWKTLGIVITADCDIAHSKHHGLLSYVPAIPMHDYVRLFYLPKAIRSTLGPGDIDSIPLSGEVVEAIRRWQAANRHDFPEPISPESALHWARSAAPSIVADELRVDKANRASLIELLEDFKLIESAISSESIRDEFEAIRRIRIRRGARETRIQDALLKELDSHMRRLPGDCFFLGRANDSYADGYVVYLRVVREINQRAVALSQSDFDKDPAPVGRRIARLRSPFVYRLTQQLSEVFASIGLPSEYEQERDRRVSSIAGHLSRQDGQ